MTTRVLTGITPSGTPHLGNYAGAIRPCIQASRRPDVDGLYFLADYHALIKCDDPQRVARSRLEIAATWLAAGLDPETTTFYRQSDIPEIMELCWMLQCVTAKGLMNRAHAYKAAVDQNVDKGVEPDDGVSMGLFAYPVLMAADILMFKAERVPVGRDQIQHLEMARDIAQRFHHIYGQGRFVLPEAQIDEDVATLPGLDGRKMSKSYDNTIPLFEGGEVALREAIKRVVTDSRAPGESKDAEGSHVFTLYRAFATPAQAQEFAQALADGLSWGEAKTHLFARIQEEIGPMRERYAALISRPAHIEDILQAGAAKARKIATPMLQGLREAVGLRSLAVPADGWAQGQQQHVADKTTAHGKADGKVGSKTAADKKPRFVSFREADGGFRFRLVAANGQELFLSKTFERAQDAGAVQKALVEQTFQSDAAEAQDRVRIRMQDQIIGTVASAVWPVFQSALRALA